MVVNLAETGGRRYLKTSIAVEFVSKNPDWSKLAGEAKVKAEKAFEEEIAGKVPIIKDTLITVLSSKMVTDLSSLDAKTALKTELLTKLNARMGEEHITALYFTQFLIQ
jgi:flagellar FliL protein